MPKNNQNEEQPKADRRHNQEVHGGDAGRMVVQKGLPGLRPPSPALRHVFGDRRLSGFDTELQHSSSPWMRGAPQSRFATLMSRIRRRISSGILGRPPRERDFQRQYSRKPVRCHRMIVSGWTMAMAANTDGNRRYSHTKSNRSATVSFGFGASRRRKTFT